jgi:uncharacterized protein (DUF486 family)
MSYLFAPFAALRRPLAPKSDYRRAAVCIMGAVHFIFRA